MLQRVGIDGDKCSGWKVDHRNRHDMQGEFEQCPFLLGTDCAGCPLGEDAVN